MVICKKCCDDLPGTSFSRNSRAKNGLCAWCKECSATYAKQYRNKNKAALAAKQQQAYQADKERRIGRAKVWYQEHKEDKKEYDKEYHEHNKDKRRERSATYYQANKEDIKRKTKKYKMIRYATDERFVVICRLRHRLREAFKRYSKNGKVASSKDYGIDWSAVFEYIGPCPGKLSDYHIDHIIPLSAFDHDDLEQIKQAWAPENHQWLSAEENLRKHTSMDYSSAVITSRS